MAGWPDSGMVYIGEGSRVPTGMCSFEKGVSEGDNPVPIFISKFKNRVKLSKKTIRDIEKNL